MKKIDFKSVLIGFLSCLVLLLTLSFKTEEEKTTIGKYQAFGTDKNKYMIDTSTGVLYYQSVLYLYNWDFHTQQIQIHHYLTHLLVLSYQIYALWLTHKKFLLLHGI